MLYQDFTGEEVSLDFYGSEEMDSSTVHSDHGCSVTVNLPAGSYDILYVETGNNNVNNRITNLNEKTQNISMDSNCDELILRIKRK